MTRLQDKVGLITGGSGGIGLATAKLFAHEGARVLLVDLDEARLREAAAACEGKEVSFVAANVAEPEQMERAVRFATERYGGLDIAFLNAGIEGVVKPIVEYPIETFDKVIAVNVRGVWLGLKYAIPALRDGGSIIVTSSVAGLRGTAGVSAYVASKHAVVGLARSAALEVAPRQIRVNTINPSPVSTRMMDSLEEGFSPGSGPQAREGFSKGIPLGRYGTPEEIAQLALFLAGDESRFISGGVYTVDGGMTAQ